MLKLTDLLKMPCTVWSLLLTLNSLLRVVQASGPTVRVLENKVLPSTLTTWTKAINNPTPKCACWTQCLLDVSCTAVSSLPQSSGQSQCVFTADTFLDSVLDNSAVSATPLPENQRTYIKLAAPVPPGCKAGYTLLTGVGCISMSSSQATKANAITNCANDGATLAVLSDITKFDLVRLHLFDTESDGDIWVHVSKRTDGEYYWADNTHIPKDSSFFDTDNLSSTCASLQRTKIYRMNDRACTDSYRYLCHYTL